MTARRIVGVCVLAACLAPGLEAEAIDPSPPAPQSVDPVPDLRSDAALFNALRAFGAIHRAVWQSPATVPEALVAELERALSSDDLQQRQMAASLLVTYYQRGGVADAQWPAVLIEVLVEGLRDDGIHGGRQVANGRASLSALFGLRDRRPVAALEGLLAGDDRQARWDAAVILAEYQAGSVQPAVTDELLGHLAADRILLNEAAAFKALRRLGEDNARDLLARVDRQALDAQQAAMLLCLGAWFGIPWQPPEEAAGEWLRQVREGPARVPTAALFVYPGRDALLAGERIPAPLERMIRLGPPGRGLVAESHWAADWIWWLRTDDPYMGLPEIAVLGDGF